MTRRLEEDQHVTKNMNPTINNFTAVINSMKSVNIGQKHETGDLRDRRFSGRKSPARTFDQSGVYLRPTRGLLVRQRAFTCDQCGVFAR
jgi:hypothetical protein